MDNIRYEVIGDTLIIYTGAHVEGDVLVFEE